MCSALILNDRNQSIQIVFKYYRKYLYLYLNTVLTKVFATVFVFEKFIVFVFVFKYYAMYLDPSLVYMYVCVHVCMSPKAVNN